MRHKKDANGRHRIPCLFRFIVTDRFGILTAEVGNLNDRFGDATDGMTLPPPDAVHSHSSARLS